MKNFVFVSIISLCLMGCSIVGPKSRGIRVTAGSAGAMLEPGPHLWFPVLYGIKTIDVSIQKTEIQASAASKDLQEVTTTVAVNWGIDPARVTEFYQTVGDEDDAVSRILTPAVNEILKSATAKKTAEEILTQRLELKHEIDESLHKRLATYGLKLNDVSIVNLSFSHDFTKAIESKQIAEQQAKQASYVAQKATQDAIAVVNAAKGQAQANLTMAESQAKSQKLLQQTLTPEVLQMEYLKSWNGVLPQVMSGSGSGVMMYNINTDKVK